MQIVQSGSGKARDVVIVHDVRDSTNHHLRIAAPSAAIGVDNILPRPKKLRARDRGRFARLGDGDDSGVFGMHAAAASLRAKEEDWTPARIVCVGVGGGARAADAWLGAKQLPDAIVSVQGWCDEQDDVLHAQRAAFAQLARMNERVLVLAHARTPQKLVDAPEEERPVGTGGPKQPPKKIDLGPRAYVETLTGFTTVDGGNVGAPHEQRDGGLVVVGYSIDWREVRAYEEIITGYCVALAMRTLDTL